MVLGSRDWLGLLSYSERGEVDDVLVQPFSIPLEEVKFTLLVQSNDASFTPFTETDIENLKKNKYICK